MMRIHPIFSIAILSLWLGGCSAMHTVGDAVSSVGDKVTGLFTDEDENKMVIGPQVVAQDVDLIGMSHSIADALVAEVRKNVPNFHRRRPLLATTFVDLANLNNSTELGMVLSDQISSRFTQHGYAIVEAKMRRDLSIRPNEGEFILSREIAKLSREHNAYAVIVGNYTESRDLLYLTTKIIKLDNNQVLASVNAKIPMGANTRDLMIETLCCSRLPVVSQ